VGATPGGKTAATIAPEAYAHAEKLRADAEIAYRNGDRIAAQTLAERAIAAYQHALVLSRVAIAAETTNRARLVLEQAEQSLAQHEAEYKRISAHADDLELRVNVIKDAMPIMPVGPSDGPREAARWSAARSLALDARLLCVGARMLAANAQGLVEAQAALADLDRRMQGQARPAPVEPAMRCRAQCLAALTAARRSVSATSTVGRSDELLAELSAMGSLAPLRDDRGVGVTLRGLFAEGQLTKEGKERLEALGRVAKAHPDFPVQVVVHAAAGRRGREDLTEGRQRGDTVAQALMRGGATEEKIWIEPAGSAHPVLDPPLTRDVRRNERVEIIFVDPGG
jgi:outer membrane protein OmpA-like peptidoglycan-associated protein